jgi:hypothetical protein
MNLTLDLMLVVILGILTWQDFRLRRISVAAILVLAALVITRRLQGVSQTELLNQFLLNIAFIILQLALLSFYWIVRRKPLKSLFDQGLGFGDILFFVIMSLAFSTERFIMFFMAGLILSLLSYGSYLLLSKDKDKSTPLAGLLSFFGLLGILLSYPLHYRIFY